MINVLIVSPEPWKWQYVSKHHYAIALAKLGYSVYFLNPPISTFSQITILNTSYRNLYEIEAPQVTKGLRFYPKKIRNYFERKWLEKLENSIGQKFTTIWLFENSRFYDMDFASNCLKIYHQVDSNQNFHLKEAASSADICFCVTDFIKRDLFPYNKKVFKIDHGINYSDQQAQLSKGQKEYLNKNGSINVAYVGNLDSDDVDRDVLYHLVSDFSHVTFHFVGTYSKKEKTYTLCKDIKNIVWWGRVESSLIATILEKVDITILTYIVSEQNANSHKLLEYFYSGKVTVATYVDEYKDKRYLLEMTDEEQTQNYNTLFEKVVENLDFYNSSEKQQQRIAFAKEHSYENQLNKIFSLIKMHTIKDI